MNKSTASHLLGNEKVKQIVGLFRLRLVQILLVVFVGVLTTSVISCSSPEVVDEGDGYTFSSPLLGYYLGAPLSDVNEMLTSMGHNMNPRPVPLNRMQLNNFNVAWNMIGLTHNDVDSAFVYQNSYRVPWLLPESQATWVRAHFENDRLVVIWPLMQNSREIVADWRQQYEVLAESRCGRALVLDVDGKACLVIPEGPIIAHADLLREHAGVPGDTKSFLSDPDAIF